MHDCVRTVLPVPVRVPTSTVGTTVQATTADRSERIRFVVDSFTNRRIRPPAAAVVLGSWAAVVLWGCACAYAGEEHPYENGAAQRYLRHPGTV
eukprot:COSAG01_NODE_8185_length_2886_cov_2.700395_1_plen_93_part_10